MSEAIKSYSISQYSQSVSRLLKAKIPPIWVNGVISQLQKRGQVVYLTLTEYAPSSEKPIATLQLMAWAKSFEQLQEKSRAAEIPFEIEKEIKVSFLLEADFYVPMGKFQARVLDIDLNFTQGEMALTRDRILKKLHATGLIHKNKSLSLPKPCLNIGLITAPDSAAYHDFTNALASSHYNFTLRFEPAVMQGDRTEASIVKALSKLNAQDLDIIVITRGGGAKTDLVYFDSELICVEIANSIVPVVSGIGHQIDQSLTDLVAWATRMTPTDCAALLIEKAQADEEELLKIQQMLTETTQSLIHQSKLQLHTIIHGLKQKFDKRLQREENIHQEVLKGLKKIPQNRISTEWQRFERNQIGLQRGASKLIMQNHIQLESLKTQLSNLSLAKINLQKESLNIKAKWVNSLSPQRTLERGYTLTRLSGQKEKENQFLSKLKEGSKLITETHTHWIESQVVSVKEKDQS